MEDEKSSKKAVSTTVEHAVLRPHYHKYRPKFILPYLVVAPWILSNDAKLVVIGKMCRSCLPKRMSNFYWQA